ncbi:hypothetical protein U1Q18_030912 [Sarracenia purpurea var. burkii]
MLSWKDKIREKIPRLFSDSPSSQSPLVDQSQARPYSNEGKSLSSIFSFILPSSSFDGLGSNKDRNDIKPIQSSPVKWKSKNLLWQDKPVDGYKECDHQCEDKETSKPSGDQKHGSRRRDESENKEAVNSIEDGDPGSASSTSSTEIFEDATDRHNVDKSMPYLTEESSFISSELYEFLQSSLPNIVKGCLWVLLYR